MLLSKEKEEKILFLAPLRDFCPTVKLLDSVWANDPAK